MNGPVVNIKFLNEFKLKWEEEDFHSVYLILEPAAYIQCMDLYLINTTWKLKNHSKVEFNFSIILLQVVKIMEVFQGQQSFCCIIEFMVEMWPNLIKLVNFWTLLRKSKEPKMLWGCLWCNARSFHDFEINVFQFCLCTCRNI